LRGGEPEEGAPSSEESSLGKVVIASETGRSALKALEILDGAGVLLIVVTHYFATIWGPERRS